MVLKLLVGLCNKRKWLNLEEKRKFDIVFIGNLKVIVKFDLFLFCYDNKRMIMLYCGMLNEFYLCIYRSFEWF